MSNQNPQQFKSTKHWHFESFEEAKKKQEGLSRELRHDQKSRIRRRSEGFDVVLYERLPKSEPKLSEEGSK